MSGSLPAIATPSLLSALRGNTFLPQQTWYFIAGVTLSVLNRPDEIPAVFTCALEENEKTGKGREDREQQLKTARRMREGLIKSAAISGVPKTINALLALKPHTPPALQDAPQAFSPTGRAIEIAEVPPSSILQRGQRFFDQVYGKIGKRVMGQMDRSGTEDLGLVARLMYGYLISNTSVLTAKETSLVLIAGLIPMDVNPQLKGHLRGALNNGATVEEVRAVREVAIAICVAAGMKRISTNEPGGWGWREEVANV